MKIHVRTYGCQMNERDSDGVSVLLEASGHEMTSDEDSAEAVIVNTCSIRAKAEDKALGKLRMLVHERKGEPVVVGAIGCMVERLGVGILRSVPGLDFAVGTHRLHTLPRVLANAASGGAPFVDVGGDDGELEALAGHTGGVVTSFVAVMRGCNRGCSYCVVPSVRGREQSRSVSSVVEEVIGLVAGGVKEVTLIGQSITAYRGDLSGFSHRSACGFTEPLPLLLEAVSAVEGLARVRFISSHPLGCTDELASAIGSLEPVCEHIHLPMQSGCSRILDMMKRGYDIDGYRSAVARLRKTVPSIAITTDVIVGYPTETVEEFEVTREAMEEIGFDNAFVFKYSPRPDTVADRSIDDVSDDEKVRRNKVLLDDQDARGRRINEGLVGKRLEVLVEGVSARDASRWTGRSRTSKIVVFEPDGDTRPGDLARIIVTRAMPQTLIGEI